MTALNGKWKLVDFGNLEAYHNAIKTREEHKKVLRQYRDNPDMYWEVYQVDPKEGTFRRSVYFNNEKRREVTYSIGVRDEEHTPSDGRPLKITLGLEGDNKITIHEVGPGFEIDGYFEAIGNDMTLSLTSQGVNTTQTFKKME